MRQVWHWVCSVGICLLPMTAAASDHADPISLETPGHPGGRISGLFAFPKDGRLVLVLNVRPGLDPAETPPYGLEAFTYRLRIDLHSRVRFDCEEDRARYGGTVPAPEEIAADVEIGLRLNDDATEREAERRVSGIDPGTLRVWTGVRDDPFILPRFERKNVVAMVLSIPFDAFPGGRDDLLIWAVTTRKKWGREVQIDHVGRANRTMLPRFNWLNEVPPGEHVRQIREHRDDPDLLDQIAMQVLRPLKALRPYDAAPDVMIFTRRPEIPPGFPNGRSLDDDVAALTCQMGDCLLWEDSHIFESRYQWPRRTTNDKPWLDGFPYLGEPWTPDEASLASP